MSAADTSVAGTTAEGSPAGPRAGRAPGLRERKKARTRAAIRRHALRLFREQGYAATTVEEIAEAAEVSPSTFFRYFPTKEDVVLQDDLDILTLENFDAQPAALGPIAAFRAAAADTFAALSPDEVARLRETTALTLSVPEVRARALDEFTRTIDVIAEAIARRTGRAPDDFAVRNMAGAIIGVIMAVSLPISAGELDDDWFRRIDAALANLEAGLPL
jgi:AcrR family transcriptional regulator